MVWVHVPFFYIKNIGTFRTDRFIEFCELTEIYD